MEAIKDKKPQRLLLWLFVQIYEPEISRRQKGPWEKLVGWGPLGGERSFAGWTNSQGVSQTVCTVGKVLKYDLH